MPSDSRHADRPVLTAAELLAHRRHRGAAPAFPTPEAVIFTFQHTLFDNIARRHPVRRVRGFYGDLLLLRRSRGRVAVAGNFGLGAPVTAVLTEDLFALGARKYIILGLAGGLQPAMQTGDLVLCDRALRDEGVSRHYLPPAPAVAADPELVRGLSACLTARGVPFQTGASWTTDAPYRELRRDVERHQRDGVKTVEMEAAALFAVARALGARAVAAFAVGDTLAGGRWQLSDDLAPAHRALQALADAAIQGLTT